MNKMGLQVKVNDAAADGGKNSAMYPTSSRGSFLKGELSRLTCRRSGDRGPRQSEVCSWIKTSTLKPNTIMNTVNAVAHSGSIFVGGWYSVYA